MDTPSHGDCFVTLKSKYNTYPGDIRASYGSLPGQWFWTWLTGKALVAHQPRSPSETLLSPLQLIAHLVWSYSVIICAVVFGITYSSEWWAYPIVWLLVVNRTRGLLHTFHYTTHSASIKNESVARFLAKYFMSIPILHTSWDEYKRIHIRTHHRPELLCTDEDPDQQFMIAHNFRRDMSLGEFYLRVFLEPLKLTRMFEHLYFRIEQNFIVPPLAEIIPRGVFWIVLFALGWYFEMLWALAVFYLFPLIVLAQFSSYIQHITEHLWFPDPQGKLSTPCYMASLTWGRFLGRAYPQRNDYDSMLAHIACRVKWWMSVVLVDLPMRVGVFMQDLSCHDFHHRSAGVNFWSIERERTANEGLPSRYGPMTETWSVWESIKILRDHLVFGETDPFRIRDWYAAHATSVSESQQDAQYARHSGV